MPSFYRKQRDQSSSDDDESSKGGLVNRDFALDNAYNQLDDGAHTGSRKLVALLLLLSLVSLAGTTSGNVMMIFQADVDTYVDNSSSSSNATTGMEAVFLVWDMSSGNSSNNSSAAPTLAPSWTLAPPTNNSTGNNSTTPSTLLPPAENNSSTAAPTPAPILPSIVTERIYPMFSCTINGDDTDTRTAKTIPTGNCTLRLDTKGVCRHRVVAQLILGASAVVNLVFAMALPIVYVVDLLRSVRRPKRFGGLAFAHALTSIFVALAGVGYYVAPHVMCRDGRFDSPVAPHKLPGAVLGASVPILFVAAFVSLFQVFVTYSQFGRDKFGRY